MSKNYKKEPFRQYFSKKCEQNVSKKENIPGKKIIQFPKRLTGLMF